MDWLKLFALLVAVASLHVTAEGPKKKIRIHLPQKVKHIHHHKKIYITNHPAPSQYAPAYLPGVKGALALPSNVGRPTITNIVPLNSLELYNDKRSRHTRVTPAATKLLPLYRARGHYGPIPSHWDETEFELNSQPESTDIYSSSASEYAGPPPTAPSSPLTSSYPPKRFKKVKTNELPRAKVLRKIKPKRLYVRTRPQLHPQAITDDEHPVSSYHEQFYSDLDDSGTIRKIKKPQRVEKIIDGDTEHIHTYSEEHIHKVSFDDNSKLTGVMGANPIASMSALTAAHPLIPLKNAQTLVAIPSDTYDDLAVVQGSMGTPSHMEYASYNPRDVTHDHIFHDHGELPLGVEVTKETLKLPPKLSYNNLGYKLGSEGYKKPPKLTGMYSRPTKPTQDFSYYEQFFTGPKFVPKKYPKSTLPTSYDNSYEPSYTSSYRPIPAFRFKDKKRPKTHYSQSQSNENIYSGKPQYIQNFQQQHVSVPAPFSIKSTVVHDYEPKHYGGFRSSQTTPLFSKYRDHLIDFKESDSNEVDHDAFASSVSVFTAQDEHENSDPKKSISIQNITFGGKEKKTYVDHLATSGSHNVEVIASKINPTDEDKEDYDSNRNLVSPTPYTIKETSPAHPYYAAMALKALQGYDTDSANNDEGYTAHLTPGPPSDLELPQTTPSSPKLYKIQSTDAIVPLKGFYSDNKQNKLKLHDKQINSKGEQRQRYNSVYKDEHSSSAVKESYDQPSHGQTSNKSAVKYGDKI